MSCLGGVISLWIGFNLLGFWNILEKLYKVIANEILKSNETLRKIDDRFIDKEYLNIVVEEILNRDIASRKFSNYRSTNLKRNFSNNQAHNLSSVFT